MASELNRMKELSLKHSRLDRRYDIAELLGRGSYAEIWMARDEMAAPDSPHATVAVKALNVFMQNDLDAELEKTLVDNFQNEAVALDRVRHPNIISRLGHGTARDLNGVIFHYLILEYLPGGDLAQIVRKGPLEADRAFDYIEQVCAGLAHAHECGVIHRDIKPQNLLLTQDLATVKIADFGVARFSQSDSPVTRVGTNIYAPPEHSPLAMENGSPDAHAALTPAADIYSLAKSVYVLLTGESPRQFANAPITSLPGSVSDKPWAPGVLGVLRKATQSDPAARQLDVNQFWQELSAARTALADDAPTEVAVRPPGVPRAHVSKGYTPSAPVRPSFNPSQRLKGVSAETVKASGRPGASHFWPAMSQTPKAPPLPEPKTITNKSTPQKKAKRLSKRTRKMLTAVLAVAAFIGILYGTQAAIRSTGVLSGFSLFSKTGTATQDVNIRKDPSADSPRVGTITRGTKVRIVKSQDNWYEVEADGMTGWVNGKFVRVE